MTDLLLFLAGSVVCFMALPGLVYAFCIGRLAWADLEEDKDGQG